MNSIYLVVIVGLFSGSSLQALVLCGSYCPFEILSRNIFNAELDRIYLNIHNQAPPRKDNELAGKPLRSSKLLQALTPFAEKNPQDCPYDYYEYGSEEQSQTQISLWNDSVPPTTNKEGLVFDMDVRVAVF